MDTVLGAGKTQVSKAGSDLCLQRDFHLLGETDLNEAFM